MGQEASKYAAFDILLEGCQVLDAEGRYLYLNEAALRQGHKTREELLGKKITDMYPGVESSAMYVCLQRCLQEGGSQEMDNEFIYADGKRAWFTLRMERVEEGVFILSIDITKQKLAEIETQNRLRRLSALREIDLSIISSTDLSQSLKAILDVVMETMEVDAANILLLNQYSPLIEFAVGAGFRTEGIKKTSLYVGQGHAGRAAMTQRTIFTPDLQHPKETFIRKPLIEGEGFVMYCAEPLVAKGKLVGVLELYNRTSLNPDKDWFAFLHTVGGQVSIAIDSGRLFQDLQRLNMELLLAYDTTIEGWSRALDLRDKETEGHTRRVTELTVRLARQAGITEDKIVHIRRGALLHDIGKMGVPDAILLKPGPLSEAEFAAMKEHPVYARDLLAPIEYLRPCVAIPYCHHEKWDGSGYPQGLKYEQIPLEARLFAVVDVWDALSNDRPYRAAWPKERVAAHIEAGQGTQFDPQAVEYFLQGMDDQTR